MKLGVIRFSLPTAILVAGLLGGSTLRAETLPDAAALLRRVVERGQAIARAGETNHYAYEKRSVLEELDDEDRVLKSTEKLYRVMLIGGLPFPRLIKIQGRALSAKELEKETQREEAFRQRITRVDMHAKARRKEGLATADLVERFDFHVTKREMVEGRPTLAMTFVPRNGAPDKSTEDKIFQKVSGTVWVDELEAEVTKLDAKVNGPVPFGWFGAIGSLNRFHATFERSRMPDGTWVNRKSLFWVQARKLFSVIRTRVTEESTGFHRE